MNRLTASLQFALIVAVASASCARADDDSKTQAASSTAKPDTHTVAKGRFQVVVTLEGAFVPLRMTEISLRPETWTDFTVAERAEHGQVVKKGDMLVRLDQRKIDQQILDEEAAYKQADFAIRQLQAEIRVLEPNVPVELAAAERAEKNAKSDLENFREIDRDLTKKQAAMEVKQFQSMVDYQKDELEQLEKMYQADDLTEETEELILKRQRNSLEVAQAYFDLFKAQQERTLQIQLPRQEADLREHAAQQAVALEKARATLPLTLSKLKIELEKHKYDFAKAGDKLKKLKQDSALFKIEAPTGGTVYYGSFANGEWSNASTAAEQMKRGGTISPHAVFMTVVELNPLVVHATAPEKDLSELSTGQACSVTPAAHSTARLRAAIESIATVPAPNGKFSAVLKLADDNASLEKLRLAPGMKCNVKAITYETGAALTVPVAAVQTDPYDDTKFYVNLVDKEDKHSRRDVTVGHRNESSVEITAGLAEGDKVLVGKPDKEKKS